MCRVFNVSKSGYYDWLRRKPSKRSQENEQLKIAIRVAHRDGRQVFGTKRLLPLIAKEGFNPGRDKVHRLKMAMGLRCKQTKAFKITTNSDHQHDVADNLLKQNFTVSAPNQVWVTDITYIRTDEGWLYLAALKDLFNKEIVGYAMSDRMTLDLVSHALFRAVKNKKPPKGLIHHSDRGSQYCSPKYQKLVMQFGMKASMSRKGNCYDNAPIESFWGSLKNELVHHEHYETRAQAKASITEYIEIFYNCQRPHSSLGYLSPTAFMKQYQNQAVNGM